MSADECERREREGGRGEGEDSEEAEKSGKRGRKTEAVGEGEDWRWTGCGYQREDEAQETLDIERRMQVLIYHMDKKCCKITKLKGEDIEIDGEKDEREK